MQLGVVLIAIIVLVFVYFAMGIKIVQQHERGLVVRVGRFRMLLDPGFQLIIPMGTNQE